MSVVKVKALVKDYGTKRVVDHVSFDVAKGEVVGLLGPNGAGKSTTIQMISGLIEKTSGAIELFDEPFTAKKRNLRKRIGVVPQELSIYQEMTAYENVAFFGGLYGLRGGKLQEAANHCLRVVGLSEHAKEKAETFSGGMKRRLNIACAIVHQPDFVIMDEPTVGIDPQSRNYILELVEEMKVSGVSILYTSHYMEEVERIADTIIVMDAGKIIASGTEEELVGMIRDVKELVIRIRQPERLNPAAYEALTGVRSLILEEGTLLFSLDLQANPLQQILGLLAGDNQEIISIEQKRIDLETVFLTLTGKTLRDKVGGEA